MFTKNVLSTGQETEEHNDDAASDNRSVQERQIEEHPPRDVGLDDHVVQNDSNITEPSEDNNSQLAAGTASYPK